MFKNSLTDLFSEEDKLSFEDGESVLIIDGHNFAYRTLFSSVFTNPEDNGDFVFWRHVFMNSFLSIIKKFSPSKVIVAFDKKPSWRYDVYSDYKSNRKGARDKAVVDFDKFFPVFNEFINDLKDTFRNIYILEIKRCEADDTMAVLTNDVFKDKTVILVSSDKDMNQLIDSERVQQFDPIKNKMIKCLNPKNELEIKIIMGDRGDAIPPIKPRTGVATAERLLKEGLDKMLDKPENAQMKANYTRNRQLIDFEYIPKKIRELIINNYREYKIDKIDSSKLMAFFTKNKLMRIMKEWQNHSEYIKGLK